MTSSLDQDWLLNSITDIDTAREAIKALRSRFQMVGFEISPDEVQAELLRRPSVWRFPNSDPEQAEEMLRDLAPDIAIDVLMDDPMVMRGDMEEGAIYTIQSNMEKLVKLLAGGARGGIYQFVLLVKVDGNTVKIAEKYFDDAPAGHAWAKSWHGKSYTQLDSDILLRHEIEIPDDAVISGHVMRFQEELKGHGMAVTTGFTMDASA